MLPASKNASEFRAVSGTVIWILGCRADADFGSCAVIQLRGFQILLRMIIIAQDSINKTLSTILEG